MVDKDEQDYGINLETVLELVSKYEQIKNSGESVYYCFLFDFSSFRACTVNA